MPVQPIESALTDLRLYDAPFISQRSTDLPVVYEWHKEKERHPQRRDEGADPPGRTFIVIIDTSEEGKAKALKDAGKVEMPYSPIAEIEKLGEHVIKYLTDESHATDDRSRRDETWGLAHGTRPQE